MLPDIGRRTAMNAMRVAAIAGLASGSTSATTNTDRYQTDRSGGPLRTGLVTVHIGDVDIEGWRSVTIPSTATDAGNWRNGNNEDYERPPRGRTTYDDLEMERAVEPC